MNKERTPGEGPGASSGVWKNYGGDPSTAPSEGSPGSAFELTAPLSKPDVTITGRRVGREDWLTYLDYSSDVTGSAHKVALALATYMNTTGSCFPAVKTIAARAKLSSRTVNRRLKELREKRLIQRERRGRRDAHTLATLPYREAPF